MTTTQWADLVFGVHLGYAGFVVFGFVAVLIGWPLNWRWIRSCWFRFTHLAAIAIVASLALLSFVCPLTVLEYRLRGFTGDAVEEQFLGRRAAIDYLNGGNWKLLREFQDIETGKGASTFQNRLISGLLYYDFPNWVFNTGYVALTALAIALLWVVPMARRPEHG